MLVLSRRINEKIVLPGLKVTIQVVALEGGRVRLGIEAPATVAILREELCQKGRLEQGKAVPVVKAR